MMNEAERDLRILRLEKRVTLLSQSLIASDRLLERLLHRLKAVEALIEEKIDNG